MCACLPIQSQSVGPLQYAGFVSVCLVGLGFGVSLLVCVVVCFSFVLLETEPHCLVQGDIQPTIIVSFPPDLGIVPSCCLPCLHKIFDHFFISMGVVPFLSRELHNEEAGLCCPSIQ